MKRNSPQSIKHLKSVSSIWQYLGDQVKGNIYSLCRKRGIEEKSSAEVSKLQALERQMGINIYNVDITVNIFSMLFNEASVFKLLKTGTVTPA